MEELKVGLHKKNAGATFVRNMVTAMAAADKFTIDNGRSLLYQSDYVNIVLDWQKEMLLVRWLRPVVSSEYRNGIQTAGRFLVKLGVERLLVNNHRMGVLTIEDQGWLARISVEVISQSRLQRLAIVSSFDMLQQLTNETLDSRVKTETPTFSTEYFLTEQDAIEWLLLPG
ncbi:hypothetical protein [Pontibacter sp. 13R65]|uniref:hypothetical protein n=1 Tax=Pontibacter sp. 13R65 TaxID=3127458 RepID=UPI00301C5F00